MEYPRSGPDSKISLRLQNPPFFKILARVQYPGANWSRRQVPYRHTKHQPVQLQMNCAKGDHGDHLVPSASRRCLGKYLWRDLWIYCFAKSSRRATNAVEPCSWQWQCLSQMRSRDRPATGLALAARLDSDRSDLGLFFR